MVIEKEYPVYITHTTMFKYRRMGYNAVEGEYCNIKFKDLPIRKNIFVDVICDYCGKEFKMTYCSYKRSMRVVQKSACLDCVSKKRAEVCMIEHGVDNVMKLPECREKVKNTNLKKFGTIAPCQNEEIKKKMSETCKQKYGCDWAIQNEEVREKVAKTWEEKYGSELFVTMVSRQQKYLHNLYGGELNYRVGKYFVDIFFKNENICMEYSGSGHNLAVQFGTLTEEEHSKRERIRTNFILSQGHKFFEIISYTDKLPSDEELFKIKNHGFEILKTYNEYTINLDTMEENYK